MYDIAGVVLTQSGTPVAEATVSIIGATREVDDIAYLTDDNGEFVVYDLQPGQYTIRAMNNNLKGVKRVRLRSGMSRQQKEPYFIEIFIG